MWPIKTNAFKLGQNALARIMVAAFMILVVSPAGAYAAGLTNRSDYISTSQASVTASHSISFTTATSANIGSVGFLFCTTAVGVCTIPAGLDTTAATLTAQSGVTGFLINNTANGDPFVFNGGTPMVSAGTVVSFTMSGITNPSAINTTFYVRITTYTGVDGATGGVDTGNVAVSTAQPVQLSGTTPPILVFCVGITITSDCTTVSGSTIDFGTFSPVATATGTSVMQAQTNAANGYAITVNGTTMASGVNTIPALSTQTASSPGTSQFGLNAAVSGIGTGVVDPSYATGGLYRFNSGDSVATASSPTDANTFTENYIVNIGGMQAAGVYTATMTYICTAAF